MSFSRTFVTIAAFLSAEGASRREMLGRGVLFVLVPWVVPIVLGLVQNGGALLFPDVPATTYDPMYRTSQMVGNWVLIAYSGFGISCECVGLRFLASWRRGST